MSEDWHMQSKCMLELFFDSADCLLLANPASGHVAVHVARREQPHNHLRLPGCCSGLHYTNYSCQAKSRGGILPLHQLPRTP
jgi:hypothetical protein